LLLKHFSEKTRQVTNSKKNVTKEKVHLQSTIHYPMAYFYFIFPFIQE